jgi:hypothetical protein
LTIRRDFRIAVDCLFFLSRLLEGPQFRTWLPLILLARDYGQLHINFADPTSCDMTDFCQLELVHGRSNEKLNGVAHIKSPR